MAIVITRLTVSRRIAQAVGLLTLVLGLMLLALTAGLWFFTAVPISGLPLTLGIIAGLALAGIGFSQGRRARRRQAR